MAIKIKKRAKVGRSRAVPAEMNQGGLMVKSVRRSAGLTARIKTVRAKQGKAERAVPIALLFEQGRVSLHGEMCSLEEELSGLVAGGAYQGPGDSADRADAMVWALGEVMVERVVRVRYARDVRNAVEHPKKHEFLRIRNFHLLPDGTLSAPVIKLVHPKRSHDPVQIGVFMARMINALTGVFETLMAYRCDRRCAVGEFSVFVEHFPPERLGRKHVRYSYAMRMGDETVPMS